MIAYISPRFPSVSLVFEQNEVLGILNQGVEVSLLVCRYPAFEGQGKLHEFARPLLKNARYFEFNSFIRGLYAALTTIPAPVLSVVRHFAREVWRKPLRAPVFFAALVLSFRFYALPERRSWRWIHADFGQGSASCGFFLSLMTGLPFSFTCHAFDIFSSAPRARESDAFFALKARHARMVFAISELGKRRVVELCGSSDEAKVIVHHVSVRVNEFAALPVARPETNYIAALGRLDPQKGFSVLIQAVSLLSRRGIALKCRIFGEGELREELEDLIDRSGVQGQVLLMGEYENGELTDILSRASMVVVPSVLGPHGQMDGVPTVIYESMALQRPVIASNISGIPEIIEDGVTGLLVPPDDAELLADRIQSIYLDPVRAERISKNARHYCEKNHCHLRQAAKLLSHLSVIGPRDTGDIRAVS